MPVGPGWVARVTCERRAYGAPVEFRAGEVDARADRLAEGSVGVLLLAAFVFRWPWLVPAVGAVLVVAIVGGTRVDPFHVLFVRAFAPRMGTADATVTADTVLAQDVLLAGLTAIATLSFLVGVAFIGWLVVIAAAVIAVVAAATGLHVGDQLRRLLSR
jgi:hypothetical protein